MGEPDGRQHGLHRRARSAACAVRRAEPGHRVSIYTRDGKLITRIGARLPGEEPDQFLWPHSVAVDSEGSIYVADVSYVEVGSKQNPPREMVSLHKWKRVSG